jgi:hypothetical protein
MSYMHSSSLCVLDDLPISSFLTWLFWLYLAKSTNYEALYHAVLSSLLPLHPFCSKYPPHTLFSNNLSLFSCLNVRHQVAQAYKTTGKITGLIL